MFAFSSVNGKIRGSFWRGNGGLVGGGERVCERERHTRTHREREREFKCDGGLVG